jgi:hypothetical protein
MKTISMISTFVILVETSIKTKLFPSTVPPVCFLTVHIILQASFPSNGFLDSFGAWGKIVYPWSPPRIEPEAHVAVAIMVGSRTFPGQGSIPSSDALSP